ncbi:MAG: hypothetical protein LAO51_09955 [Acidobacteriia bacterium]|nr:hypothetical protein [Terriglobia bacterium]
MYSDFEELNLFAYWALVNGLLDAVLWCLGPYVDDSREYGLFRHALAEVTRRLVLIWLLLREFREHPA